jgi:hypothetical protein
LCSLSTCLFVFAHLPVPSLQDSPGRAACHHLELFSALDWHVAGRGRGHRNLYEVCPFSNLRPVLSRRVPAESVMSVRPGCSVHLCLCGLIAVSLSFSLPDYPCRLAYQSSPTTLFSICLAAANQPQVCCSSPGPTAQLPCVRGPLLHVPRTFPRVWCFYLLPLLGNLQEGLLFFVTNYSVCLGSVRYGITAPEQSLVGKLLASSLPATPLGSFPQATMWHACAHQPEGVRQY